MTDVVAIIAGLVALTAALYRGRRRGSKPRLPMAVDDGPQLDLMAQVRRRNFQNHVERAREAKRLKS